MNKVSLLILRSLIVSVLLSSLAFLEPIGAVSGAERDPEAATDPSGSGEPWYDPDSGIWYMRRGSTGAQAPDESLATGGPDVYGYTWDDSVASSWMEISATGTDAGLSGPSSGVHTGPISLPFYFDYYENTYNEVYIAASGYIGFTISDGWPWMSEIPSEPDPNDLIAPYATPIRLAASGPANRVYYASGGSTPNQWFAVEWYQVVFNEFTYTFQVILHENGDIVFNYLSIPASYICAVAGIEDKAGLDGLSYFDQCENPPANPSVRFYRPAATARIDIKPPYVFQFSHADDLTGFPITIRNLGELGSDIYDLTSVSTWPVSFFDIDGVTALDDTDTDGIIDTGSIAQGSSRTVIAKMHTPPGVSVGDDNCGVVTATSSLNTGKYDTTELCSTIPAPFAGVFMDNSNGAVSLDLVERTGQNLVKITADDVDGEESAVAETGTGFVTAWTQYSYNGSRGIQELNFVRTNRSGVPQGSVQKMIDNSGAVYDTYDENPVLAVAPDGSIGIFWKHYLENSLGQFNTNLYFAIVNETGTVLYGPTNITNNPSYGDYGDMDFSGFKSPGLTATPDNHFVMVWEKYTYGVDFGTSDVYLSARNSSNSVITLPKVISTSGMDTGPSVESIKLRDDRILVAYTDMMGVFVYSLYNTAGEVVSDYWIEIPVHMTQYNSYVHQSDAVELSTGEILLAFAVDDISGEVDNTGYVIIEPSAYTHTSPVYLDNPYAIEGETGVSVTADQEGHGILVAMDNDASSKRLYYSLVNHNGSLITSPRPFYSSQDNTDSIYTNGMGYAITTLWIPPEGVDLNIHSTRRIVTPLGSEATIPISFGNAGQTTATGVTITAELWWGLTYVSDTSGITPEIVGDTITWNIPDLVYQADGSFNLIVSGPSGSSEIEYPVFIDISGQQTETNLYDNFYGLNVVIAEVTYLPMIQK